MFIVVNDWGNIKNKAIVFLQCFLLRKKVSCGITTQGDRYHANMQCYVMVNLLQNTVPCTDSRSVFSFNSNDNGNVATCRRMLMGM